MVIEKREGVLTKIYNTCLFIYENINTWVYLLKSSP
jgi:hypothetical protein